MTNALQRNRVRGLSNPLADVDQFFNQVFSQSPIRSASNWRTPVTLWETDDKFHLDMDVPGVVREDIELTFDKGDLAISVERRSPEGDQSPVHNERVYGKVTRTFSLPETVDPESIEAHLENGVLHVAIAKLPQSQPKRIEVQAR